MFLLFFLQPSCKKTDKEEPVVIKEVVAEKKNVKTYEIVDIITKQGLSDKYNATFGSLSIELIKTSDTTLSFYVPDVAEGSATLKFALATLDFNVSKTIAPEENVVITTLNQNFNAQLQTVPSSTPEQTADIDSAKRLRQDVLELFKLLTPEQKTEALLIYEANKAAFQELANSLKDLDAGTTMRIQSACPKTNFKNFYSCTGKNLGDASQALKNSFKRLSKLLLMSAASASLAPFSLGLSSFGAVVSGGAAFYLSLTETFPAFLKFKNALFPYLEARWVFSKALFEVVVADFNSEVSTNLNLAPKFRTLTAADGAVDAGVDFFINSMKSLEEYWNKLTAIFGQYPSYKNNETATTLATADITISGVSNPSVQYVGHTNQSVTFKSTSGKNESFSYKVKVTKEGFVEEKTLSALVKVNCPTITFSTNMGADGSIAIQNVQGGVAPYMYSLANSPYQSNIIFVGPYVSGNSYLVKVKDANNCETTETRIISKEPCGNFANITDARDGEVYKIVQIGSQTWFAENLRASKYRNNAPITNITDNTQWTNNTSGGWCYNKNDPAYNGVYGKLYNWYAVVNAAQICPAGWHVPTYAEWTTLVNYLGGTEVAGGKMKTTGTQYWVGGYDTPFNKDATNSSCFSALPGGSRDQFGDFGSPGSMASFWSVTESGTINNYVWTCNLRYETGGSDLYDSNKKFGLSVRCLKD